MEAPLEMDEVIENKVINDDDNSKALVVQKTTPTDQPLDNLALVLPKDTNSLETFDSKNSVQTVPHLEAPKISNLNCSSCNDVQIGTRIITSNLTVLGDGKITLEKLDKESVGESRNIIKETLILSKRIWWFVCLLLVVLTVLTYFVLKVSLTSKVDDGEEGYLGSSTATHFSSTHTIPSTNTTEISTEQPLPPGPSWLITKRQCGMRYINCDPLDLSIVNKIKLVSGFSCGQRGCCKRMEQSQQWAISEGNKTDIEFHFAVNEDGNVFEGRNYSCQTEKEYRDCNSSLLLVRIYRDDEEDDAWYDHHAHNIINGLLKIVSLGQNASFISGTDNDSVVFHLAEYWSNQYFTKKLNEYFRNLTFYESAYNRSC